MSMIWQFLSSILMLASRYFQWLDIRIGHLHARGKYCQAGPYDCLSQCHIVCRSIASWGITADRLAKARAFRQLDISANARCENPGLGPGGVSSPTFVEIRLPIGSNFLHQASAGLVHAKDNSGH